MASIGDGNRGTEHDVVTLDLAAILAVNGDVSVFVECDEVALEILHHAQFVEANVAIGLRFDHRLLKGARSGAADVERAHRKLRARFANGLRGNDANSFPELDHLAGRQVSPITVGAHPAFAVAGEHGPNLELLDADLLNRLGCSLLDELVLLHHVLATNGILDRLATDAANDAGREIDHLFVALVDRLDDDAVDSAAVHFVDDDVLRRIHELAREIARVGGLQCGVGKAFARTVRRNEVFEHGESLAEV
jgi:hypothetical protein